MPNLSHQNIDLTPLECDVLCTLIYFDIFHYPLTTDEIITFGSSKELVETMNIDSVLKRLVSSEIIYLHDGFYSLRNEPELAIRRRKGNQLASKKLKLAYRISKFISCFPFVRAVMLSGSISKGYMDKNSDIDFFIITKPGSLWVTRTLLVVFKRIFLFNSHKHFCVNYFIDAENLEIEEKNLFTATESITLIPTYGRQYYQGFLKANNWVYDIFPNFQVRCTEQLMNEKSPFLKRWIEALLDNRFGRWLDDYFMGLTYKRWQNKFSHGYSENDFEVAFKTKKYASKNHPKFYQKKILDKYAQKVNEFEKVFNVRLKNQAA